ncbi:MAG: hypothetical protein QXW32_06435 [Nitrososphaerales archaeon]
MPEVVSIKIQGSKEAVIWALNKIKKTFPKSSETQLLKSTPRPGYHVFVMVEFEDDVLNVKEG